jgi:hypothetical protein
MDSLWIRLVGNMWVKEWNLLRTTRRKRGPTTPSFKAKTKCIPLCVRRSIFTHKATNSEINSITSVYYNIA